VQLSQKCRNFTQRLGVASVKLARCPPPFRKLLRWQVPATDGWPPGGDGPASHPIARFSPRQRRRPLPQGETLAGHHRQMTDRSGDRRRSPGRRERPDDERRKTNSNRQLPETSAGHPCSGKWNYKPLVSDAAGKACMRLTAERDRSGRQRPLAILPPRPEHGVAGTGRSAGDRHRRRNFPPHRRPCGRESSSRDDSNTADCSWEPRPARSLRSE
jgi:hypothetical protein